MRSRPHWVEVNFLSGKFNEASFGYKSLLRILIIIWFIAIHIAGVYLFTHGFLLTRIVLENSSQCLDDGFQWIDNAFCQKPKFDKLVFVVIDALRFDFTIPVTSGALRCHNIFDYPYLSTVDDPRSSRLYRFIADPPTTTLQRLKGLTTGSLPTFFDAGSNFAGTEILEDNLISQLRKANKTIAFIGDDTWTSLYPGSFHPDMTWDFESLNVWDLHTVDHGVNSHLFDLLGAKGWDVIIAHYLGVDHAGHRFGPDHPEMAAKLTEMNDNVKRISRSIDAKTLLVVLGDHGMDPKGDHGGDSPEEVESALWIYSKQPFLSQIGGMDRVGRTVSQVDLLPTLSPLFGLPIPFNNLGCPIAEAFPDVHDGSQDLAKAYAVTANQISRFDKEYVAIGGREYNKIDQQKFHFAKSSYRQAEKGQESWENVFEAFAEYQRSIIESYRRLWAKFNPVAIMLGIIILLLSLISAFLLVQMLNSLPCLSSSSLLLCKLFAGGAMGALLAFFSPIHSILRLSRWHVTLFAANIGSIGSFIHQCSGPVRLEFLHFFGTPFSALAFLVPLLHAFLFASNSYTVWEDLFTSFFLVSFGLVSLLMSFGIKQEHIRAKSVYQSIFFLLLSRIASLSKLCREEQMPYCQTTFYASSGSSTSSSWALLFLFPTALLSLLFIYTFYTPISDESRLPRKLTIGFGLASFLNFVHWLLDACENEGWLAYSPIQMKFLKRTLARLVLSGCLFSSVVLWTQLARRKSSGGKSNPTRSMQNYLMQLMLIFIPLTLLQKPLGALSCQIFLLQVFTLRSLLEYHHADASFIAPVVLSLMGHAHFFSTGHQATLSSIQWDTAFISLDRVVQPFSSLLILANTYASYFLSALSLPLVIQTNKSNEHFFHNIYKGSLVMMLYHAIIAVSSMIFAAWLRRHLMVWKIFAPRYMTSSAVLMVTDLTLLFMLFILIGMSLLSA